jgi:DNA-binding HxlR family transcriptional regulator
MSRKAARSILVDSFVDLRGVGDLRWVTPALAMLHDRKGEKYVTLWRGLGASQRGIRTALDATIARGWVERNPGYGHPMRPEYVLTKKGMAIGEACSQIMKGLEGVPWKELTKWSMAVIYVLRFGPYRFNQLASVLEGITDRALVMCLKPLVSHGLVLRQVDDSFPPSVMYSLTPTGETVLRPISRLAKLVRGRTGRA